MELVDFEWRFGVTASTSEVQQVGRTFVHLKLVLEDPTVGDRDVRTIELSVEKFYQLLSQLEQAQGQLEDILL
ncbi:COMM domain-containing protein [Chloropicon roscoffensis]|uniref:COMM domain-containing protein n=1 Tax=Chloropicon roscoffensis TaxID=1461544 RepID=A0AAX4PMW1_9CHLO